MEDISAKPENQTVLTAALANYASIIKLLKVIRPRANIILGLKFTRPDLSKIKYEIIGTSMVIQLALTTDSIVKDFSQRKYAKPEGPMPSKRI